MTSENEMKIRTILEMRLTDILNHPGPRPQNYYEELDRLYGLYLSSQIRDYLADEYLQRRRAHPVPPNDLQREEKKPDVSDQLEKDQSVLEIAADAALKIIGDVRCPYRGIHLGRLTLGIASVIQRSADDYHPPKSQWPNDAGRQRREELPQKQELSQS